MSENDIPGFAEFMAVNSETLPSVKAARAAQSAAPARPAPAASAPAPVPPAPAPSPARVCALCLTPAAPGEKLLTCVRCKKVYYHDRQCQKEHWSEHRKVCAARSK